MNLKSNAGANDSEELQPQSKSREPNDNRFCRKFGYLLTIVILFLQYNQAISMYSSRRILSSSPFVITSYAELMVVFSYLRKHENLTADAPTGVVWVLCSLLTCTFTWRINSQILPLYMNIIIWGMSVSLLVVGFYFFFLFQSEDAQLANKEEKKICKLSPDDKV